MSAPITPMTLGDIFDRLFKLVGKTWLRNLIICSIVLLPATVLFAAGLDSFFSNFTDLIEEGSTEGHFDPANFVNIFGTIIWMVLASFLFAIGTYGATLSVSIVGCAEMQGDPMEWNDALGKGFGVRFLRLIGMFLLQMLIIGCLILIPYGLVIVAIAMESVPLGLLAGLLLMAAVFFTIFLSINWAFTIPVIGWEEKGVIDSFKRSWNLVQGNWWRVFGILILMGIIVSFAASIVLTPLYFIFLWDFFAGYFRVLTEVGMGERPDVSMFVDLFANIGIGIGLLSGISSILQLLVAPLYTVVLYFDLRARKGEFPLAPIAGQAAPPAPAAG